MQRNNLNHFVDDLQVIWDTEEKCQGGIDRLISSEEHCRPITSSADLIIGPTAEARL
jgi:hypothetical protein